MDGASRLRHDPARGFAQRRPGSPGIPGFRVRDGDRSVDHGAVRDRRHPATLRERGSLSFTVLIVAVAASRLRASCGLVFLPLQMRCPMPMTVNTAWLLEYLEPGCS